jgi:predicted nucleotide-binding protein (sugar kinase/HSP70/actin superfamily)
MEEGKQNLITALNTSVKELQQGIDLHCRLLTSVLQGNNESQDLLPVLDTTPKQSQEQMMREAINEAIEELEASRKAFKSKKLEALRKKLTQVLINPH